MNDGTQSEGSQLTQALDTAYAAYKRHYGRSRGMERLRLMLMRDFEAQSVLDSANAAIGTPVQKAAE